jgi:hypothetical protein
MSEASIATAPSAGTAARAGRPKLFGIGLNKTGTSSLHEALTRIGLRSLHFGGDESNRRVSLARRQGQPLLHHFPEEYDAYSDIGLLTKHFELVDQQYPGSKFILTVRDIDDWIDSRRRHVTKNIERRAQGLYDGSFLEIDETAWWHEYRNHHKRVRAYFAGRPGDLLVLDICGGDGYEDLCPFLELAPLDEPFPRKNRDRSSRRADLGT